MSILPQITSLEHRLALLIREWERYFAGDLRVPPEKERTAIQRQLRQLTEKGTQRRTEQYRLEQLQHRFMTYVQMWERQADHQQACVGIGFDGVKHAVVWLDDGDAGDAFERP